MRGVFESEGDIRSVDLLSALVALWRERAGGALRFSRPGATAGFDLVDGELVATLSSQSQFDTAAILIRAGKLDPAAVERLTIPEGGDAAVAAMQAGLITAREMRWGQKIRAVEVLSDLLSWLEGEYVREAGISLPPGDWTLPVPRLVLELFLRSRDRTLVEHFLGAPDLPLVKTAGFDEEFETFGLTSDAGAVVALIDGKASAEEIAETSNADEFAVLKLLAALATLGLVHPAEAAPAADLPRPAGALRETRREPARASVEPLVEGGEPPSEIGAQAAEDSPAAPGDEPEEALSGPVALTPFPLGDEGEPAESESEETREPPGPVLPPAPAQPPRLQELVSPPSGYSDRAPRETPAADPVLDFGGGHEPPGPPKRGSAALLLGLLAVLVIAVAALVVSRSHGGGREPSRAANDHPTPPENAVFPPAETAVPLPTQSAARPRPPIRTQSPFASAAPATPVPTRVRPTLPPTAVPTRSAPTKPPTAPPTRAAPTKPPTAVPTRAAPTRAPTLAPTPPPTRVPTRVAPAPTAVASSRAESTRADWARRAERDRESLSRRRDVRFAVQLELACEVETLQKAWNWDRPSGTIWLLPTSYRGRGCFRVLWGRYASLAQAREARKRVPEFFTAPGNRPTVVSVR
jgi:septal ring-binding cell division protein DamX